MKTTLSVLALAMILSSCAGSRSDQTPTINGNNNTITINQTPSVDKASNTDIDAAGSGSGDVK
jgi:PBP1b-binding outer membrane lipoprotein LpoB